MRRLKREQALNATYYLVGRAGRFGMSAHDISIATGYSDAHVHRLLMELGRLGAVRRIECHPDVGNSYYIYKDNSSRTFGEDFARLRRDYIMLCLVRGMSALEVSPSTGRGDNE